MKKLWKYLLRAFLAAVVITASVFGYGFWQMAYHVPDSDPTPLPAQLVDANSEQGKALLAASEYKADYPGIAANFEGQSRLAYCGVASSVIVLNALHQSRPGISGMASASPMQSSRITQQNFFDEPTRQVMTPFDVAFGGMTLEQNEALLRAHGLDAHATHAADSSLDKFRELVKQNLATPDDYVLVNYSRKPLGEDGGGHFSPLAAYDAASDEVLVMDVTDYNYPPTWAPLPLLWNAMNTIDGSSHKTRGFVEIQAH
jgi:hypothetical protein